ncbi:MAG: LysR family transcriptional regulator [Steroidobacter sp.]
MTEADIHPHISIDQWRSLLAVVDAGGYAQAAEHLHKSQSSVTYAVKKMESLLQVKLFDIHGRKAVLTPTGQLLYRRARALLQEATGIERAARKLSAGWEAEIGLAVEPLFPTPLLFKCLAQFGEESPHTRIEVIESVLSGTQDALHQGKVELAISGMEMKEFSSEVLLQMRMIAVASPLHPLHQLNRALTLRDLRQYRHLVVRDSGVSRNFNVLALEAVQRWTVTNMSTSIDAVKRGYGFAWYPEDKIREELNTGLLKPLNLREGSVRIRSLYLVYADRDAAGPGVLRLAQIIHDAVKAECPPLMAHVEAGKQVEKASEKKSTAKTRRKAK